MRIWSRNLMLLVITATLMACGGNKKPATPRETFMTYTKAIQKKDTTTMKLLLSNGTIKMHEKEAKASATTVDDIVKRQTLFGENQKSVYFRNEKIDGEKATLEVKNTSDRWETVPFVFEEGAWKIDKQGYIDIIQTDIQDEQNRKFDELINGSTHAPGQPVPQSTPNF